MLPDKPFINRANSITQHIVRYFRKGIERKKGRLANRSLGIYSFRSVLVTSPAGRLNYVSEKSDDLG